MTDSIFALASGSVPAAIAVLRISGPAACHVAQAVHGLPEPRRASLRRLTDPADGTLVDRALVLWFPGPDSSTGEEVLEWHLHGGRAVVAAAERVLMALGCRPAEAGEFTRRAFANGRIDLTEAEGLAELTAATSDAARRAALAQADGGLSRAVAGWQARTLELAARVEAAIDFDDEDDVSGDLAPIHAGMAGLRAELLATLAAPSAERLRDGVRVVLAGPPNAGKSSLFNALIGRDAAIVTAVPGTTRDVLEAAVEWDGVPILLQDTAGQRDTGDEVERIGVARAEAAMAAADLVLWLGDGDPPAGALALHARADERAHKRVGVEGRLAVSVVTGEGLATLRSELVTRARTLLPGADQLALTARHRAAIGGAAEALAVNESDPLLIAEQLRAVRGAWDRLTGRAGTEEMLDALFGRFCVGK